MSLLIKNGTLVTAAETFSADRQCLGLLRRERAQPRERQ